MFKPHFFKGEEINKDFPFSTGEEHGGFRYDVQEIRKLLRRFHI